MNILFLERRHQNSIRYILHDHCVLVIPQAVWPLSTLRAGIPLKFLLAKLLPSLRWPTTRREIATSRDNDPSKPDDTSDHAISYLALNGIIAELQPQSTIDYGHSDESASPPDVGDSPDGAAVLPLVEIVVKES